jgi:hypothetical protein
MKLRQDQVLFHHRSYADPSGRVFQWNGNLYRAINHGHVKFFQELFSRGIIQELVQKKILIDTDPTEVELDGYGLVLKHRTIPVESYCYEWCDEMLKTAALSVLQLQNELLKHGLMLNDPHPWNVLFDGPLPVWVDLGSIRIISVNQYASSFEIFHAYFTRPLKIIAAGHERVARLLLRDEYQGVEDIEEKIITEPIRSWLSKVRSALEGLLSSGIAGEVSSRLLNLYARKLPSLYARHNNNPKTAPDIFLSELKQEIEKIEFKTRKTDWSDYDSIGFSEFTPSESWSLKQHSFYQIFNEKKPASVTDIGSNRGWYSQLAAHGGARVVSLDNDAPSITKLFLDSSRGALPILPLLMDFRTLGSEYRPPVSGNRLRSEMALALALVHHLVFKQNLQFKEIVDFLAMLAGKWLVVEFIALDDPHIKKWLNGSFDWYNLDNFIATLNTEFKSVRKFLSNLESRQILLCEK